jgi:membrane protease YdiL (CAAX protease family)
MLQEMLNAALQILAFSLIPFTVYLIRQKKVRGFASYIGWKRSNSLANGLALLGSLFFLVPTVGLAYVSETFRELLFQPETMTGKFRAMGLGLETVLVLVVAAVFKTALSEEIFFRGFLAKRLIGWLGYLRGNWAQALLFGLLHGLIFLALTQNAFFLLFILAFTTAGAFFMGYLNEKKADGSILPGWIAHGTANLISYAVIGFVMPPN